MDREPMADTYEMGQVEDRAAWDGLVKQSSQGTIFSTWVWLECAQAAAGGEARRLGCFRNGRLVGGCGFVEIRKGGLRKATTPVLSLYGGVLTLGAGPQRPGKEESERNRVVSELAGELSRRYHYVRLSHAPAFGDARPFDWAKWKTHVEYTYVLDLSDPNRLRERLEPSLQRQIKKAARSGLVVREADDMESFVPHYVATYERQGVAPSVPVKTLVAFYEVLRAHELCRMYLAEDPDGNVLSGCIVVFGLGTCYNWIAAADPRFKQSGATPFLFWSVFERLSGHFARFDMVGANMPAIAKFKRGFGGELASHFVTEKHRSLLCAAAMKGYTALRRAGRRA